MFSFEKSPLSLSASLTAKSCCQSGPLLLENTPAKPNIFPSNSTSTEMGKTKLNKKQLSFYFFFFFYPIVLCANC